MGFQDNIKLENRKANYMLKMHSNVKYQEKTVFPLAKFANWKELTPWNPFGLSSSL